MQVIVVRSRALGAYSVGFASAESCKFVLMVIEMDAVTKSTTIPSGSAQYAFALK